jgi:hypothetical protein
MIEKNVDGQEASYTSDSKILINIERRKENQREVQL